MLPVVAVRHWVVPVPSIRVNVLPEQDVLAGGFQFVVGGLWQHRAIGHGSTSTSTNPTNTAAMNRPSATSDHTERSRRGSSSVHTSVILVLMVAPGGGYAHKVPATRRARRRYPSGVGAVSPVTGTPRLLDQLVAFV